MIYFNHMLAAQQVHDFMADLVQKGLTTLMGVSVLFVAPLSHSCLLSGEHC